MPKERWFPIQYELPDGTKLGKVVASGGDWQIFRVDRENVILAAKSALAEKWVSSGLLPESVLLPFAFGQDTYLAPIQA